MNITKIQKSPPVQAGMPFRGSNMRPTFCVGLPLATMPLNWRITGRIEKITEDDRKLEEALHINVTGIIRRQNIVARLNERLDTIHVTLIL